MTQEEVKRFEHLIELLERADEKKMEQEARFLAKMDDEEEHQHG